MSRETPRAPGTLESERMSASALCSHNSGVKAETSGNDEREKLLAASNNR